MESSPVGQSSCSCNYSTATGRLFINHLLLYRPHSPFHYRLYFGVIGLTFISVSFQTLSKSLLREKWPLVSDIFRRNTITFRCPPTATEPINRSATERDDGCRVSFSFLILQCWNIVLINFVCLQRWKRGRTLIQSIKFSVISQVGCSWKLGEFDSVISSQFITSNYLTVCSFEFLIFPTHRMRI